MKSNTQGFGVAIAIILVAILSIGGYFAVRYAQKQNAETESTNEDMMIFNDSKSRITAGLKNLQVTLNSNLGLDAKVKATTDIIADLKTDIAHMNASVSADMKTELQALDEKLTQLEIDIKSNTEDAKNSISEIIDDIQASISTDAEINSNMKVVDTTDDSVMNNDSADNMMDTNKDSNANSSSKIEASTRVELGN